LRGAHRRPQGNIHLTIRRTAVIADEVNSS
jgi:hypothetical protein